MNRLRTIVCGVLAILMAATAVEPAHASWGAHHYGGYQPWWNIFAKRHRHMSAEEERLQRFWHDYYDALKRYYGSLNHIDWVAYYKNHGYQINTHCGPQGGSGRVMFAPVFVSPQMQWAVPNANLTGAPAGHPGVPPGLFGHLQGPMHH